MPVLKRVLATVERDATCKPSVDVFQHEVKILEAIHGGRGSVVVTKNYQRAFPDFNLHLERQRLEKYYNTNDLDVVTLVYGRGMERLAKAVGVELVELADGDLEPQQQGALIEIGGDPYGELEAARVKAEAKKDATGAKDVKDGKWLTPAQAKAYSGAGTAAQASPEPPLADAANF